MRHGSGCLLLTAAFQYSFGVGTILHSLGGRSDGSWSGESPGGVELRQRTPILTWTSFITITITTTLGVDPTTLPTQTTPHTPFIVTVPGPITTTSIGQTSATLIASLGSSTTATQSVATSDIPPTSTSGGTIGTIGSLSTALAPTLTAASTSSSFISTATPTITVTSSSASGAGLSTSALGSLTDTSIAATETSTTSVAPVESTNSTAAVPEPAGGDGGRLLGSGQIAAIVAGIIAFSVFILVMIYIIRAYIIHQRQNLAKTRQELNEAAAMSRAIQSGAAGSGARTSYSHGGAGSRNGFGARGGLHDGEIRIVIQPTPPTTHLNRGLWPSPPGYTERYTYFSGRSTTTTEGENSTDHGQWSRGTEHGSSGLSRGTPR